MVTSPDRPGGRHSAASLRSTPARTSRSPARGRWETPCCRSSATVGTTSKHYRIELDYDPAANRFDEARTTIRARATKTLTGVQLRLPGRPRGDQRDRRAAPGPVPVRGRHPEAERRPGGHPAEKAGRHAAALDPAQGGTQVHGGGQLPGHPGADHRSRRVGRRLDPGLLPAGRAADLRRRVRRQRADGGDELVPVQQLPDRQGDVRHAHHRAGLEDRDRHRRARLAPATPGRYDDLALDRGRPDRRRT